VVLAACSDPEPHKVVPCKGYLDNTGQPFNGTCELPCQTASSSGGAPVGNNPGCTGRHGGDNGPVVMCATTLDYEGIKGCCSSGTDGSANVEFFTCL